MIRLFYVIDSLDIGGAQRQLLELLRRLDRRRYQAAVCPLWPLMALEPDYQQTGWPIVKIHKKAHMDISITWRLAREMRAFQPHIVHTFLFTGNLWGRLAAALARTPAVISTQMSVIPKAKRLPYMALVDQVLAGVTDIMTFDSYKGQRECGLARIMGRPSLKVIHNGADLQVFEAHRFRAGILEMKRSLEIGENCVVLGNIARLTEQKGQEVLLRAASLLIREGRNLRVMLVGDGPKRSELESLADTLGIRDYVHFLGPRHDLPELLSLFDIFVLSSHWESLPVIVLEAMAMARPVVASDVAGVSEMVDHETTGLLVKAGEPQLLADALLRLMSNPESAVQMGLAGRARVEQDFSVERMVEETTALYDDLLKQKGIHP